MRIIEEALTFDDVLLVPAHSSVLPKDVDLTTRVYSAPMSGEALFEAVASLLAPRRLDLGGLQDQLHDIADRLDLDLTLQASEVAAPSGGAGDAPHG